MLGKKLTLGAVGNNQQEVAAAAADFTDNTLLIQGDTSNSSVTYKVFDDTSGNFDSLQANGDARASSFTPYGTNWSFDFSGQYNQRVTSSSVSNVGSGNFTIECWVYFNSINIGNYQVFLKHSLNGSWSSGWTLNLYQGELQVYETFNSTGFYPEVGRWYHVAFTRSGTTARLFVDGTIIVTDSSNSTSYATNDFSIGNDYTDNYQIDGYVSNVRIINGTCLYTSAFTPPTSNLTAVTNTEILTAQTNRFIDSSSPSRALTLGNDPAISGFSPYAETNTTDGSVYLDGSTDYVRFPNNTGGYGTSNFTVEAWVYLTANPSGDTGIIEHRPPSTNGSYLLLGLNSSGQAFVYVNSGYIISPGTGTAIPKNAWTHVAVVRSSGNMKLYINGTSVASIGDSTNYGTSRGYIGYHAFGAAALKGYIADVRTTIANAVYTSSFTPPTSALTAVAGTEVLTLQKRGSVRNEGFIDAVAPERVMRVVGDVKQGSFSPFSKEEGKWGVDLSQTNGAHLRFSDSTSLNLSGQFTIELWHKQDSYGTNNCRIFQRGANSTTGYCLLTNTNGTVKFGRTDEEIVGFNQNLNDSQWHHFAVTRDGSNTVRLYFDGVLKDSATMADNLNQSGDLFIGHYPGEAASTTNRSNGQFSNFRLVTGSALYTGASFTPSTTPLTAVSGTQILALQSNRFVNNSGTGIAVTAHNYPAVTTSSPFANSTAYDPETKGGSAYVDTSGEYLRFPADTPLTMNDSNWTVDFWMYPTSYVNGQGIWGSSMGGGPAQKVAYQVNSGQLAVYVQGSIAMQAAYPDLKTWTHVLVERLSNGNGYIYYNGVQKATNSVSTSETTSDFQWFTNGEGQTTGMEGYISCARVSGVARANGSNFSVPTALPTIDDDTASLLNFSNAGIFDGTARYPIGVSGNTHANNSVKKYGTGSIFFDGSSDFLIIDDIKETFGNSDFTIEFWMNTGGGSDRRVLAFGDNNASGSLHIIYTGQYMRVNWESTGGATGTRAVNGNTWKHFALVRSSGNLKSYVDGTQDVDYGTVTVNFNNPYLSIGGSPGLSSNGYVGYIDDLRLTKGVARYTSNFTPPSAKLPNQ